MQSYTLDGQTQDISPHAGDGLGNVIDTLSSEAAKNGRFIASLRVNGEQFEALPESCAGMVLADVNSLEITTESTEQLALEALAEGGSYLDELRSLLLQVAASYRGGDETKGRTLFMDLIQGLEWFVKIASTAKVLLKVDFDVTSCAGKTLNQSVDDLNRVLMEIIVAQEQRDWVLLTDLLEYELAPQLELWREIFTMLRQRETCSGNELPRS